VRAGERPRKVYVVTAPASGVLTRLDAMAVGMAAWRLGAGRAKQGAAVQEGAAAHPTAGRGRRRQVQDRVAMPREGRA